MCIYKTITLLLICLTVATQAFTMPRSVGHSHLSHRQVAHMEICPSRGDLTKMNLGGPFDKDENVNVNLVNSVDSFTLTAIGFGLIALNFFVFANMGDVGIGGFVARIINFFS